MMAIRSSMCQHESIKTYLTIQYKQTVQANFKKFLHVFWFLSLYFYFFQVRC